MKKSHRRINRNALYLDSNLKNSNLKNFDNSGIIVSRIGGDTSSRKPVPGYCLKFDSNNPNVYIDTHVPCKEIVARFKISELSSGYVKYSDGLISSSSYYNYTDYIECQPNTIYYCNNAFGASASNIATIVFYNSSKTFISAQAVSKVISPPDAAYCRMSVLKKESSYYVAGTYEFLTLYKCLDKDYNIIIKGEGTTEALYADTTGETYRICQYKTFGTGEYFNLSYIAIRNIDTNTIEHLFECEENSGSFLWDAITGDYAELKNISNISILRSQAYSKEYVKDYSNLDNVFTSLKPSYGNDNKPVYGAGGVKCSNILTSYKDFSVCYRFKCTKQVWDGMSNQTRLWGFRETGTNDQTFLTKYNKNFSGYARTHLSSSFNFSAEPYLDNQWHSFVFCINGTTGIKVYADGVLVLNVSNNKTPPESLSRANPFTIGEWVTNYELRNIHFKDFILFKEDISNNSGLDYTIADYTRGCDLPVKYLADNMENYSNLLYMDSIGYTVGNTISGNNGTATRISNTKIEFDNYSTAQFEMKPMYNYIGLNSHFEDVWFYEVYKVDLARFYNGVLTSSLDGIDMRVSASSTNYIIKSGANAYPYVSGSELICQLFDENNSEKIYEYTTQISDSNRTIFHLNLNTLANNLLRTEAETPRVRYLHIYRKCKSKCYIEPINGAQNLKNYKPSFVINSAGNVRTITGSIELISAKVLHSPEFVMGNLSSDIVLDKTQNNNNAISSATKQPIRSIAKQYGTFANAVGFRGVPNCTSIMSDTLGCDYTWTDANGNAQVGWTGAPYSYIYNGVVKTGNFGGRGTISDGTNQPVPISQIYNGQLISTCNERNQQIVIRLDVNGNPHGIMCCENRDLSHDLDCPDEIKYALNILSYKGTSEYNCLVIGQTKALDSNYGNVDTWYNNWLLAVITKLKDLGFNQTINTKLKIYYSIWVKKLSHPMEGTAAYTHVNSGLKLGAAATNSIVIPFADIPYTWTKFEGTFIMQSHLEWIFQFVPTITGMIYETDPLKWTSNEPCLAFAKPRFEFISVYDQTDTTKEYDIRNLFSDEDYEKIYPRKVLTNE